MNGRTGLVAMMFGLAVTLSPLAAWAQVKIGVVQGLSGAPAIVERSPPSASRTCRRADR